MTAVNDLAWAEGLRLGPGVAAAIARACDGDRAVMAREVEKLATFVDAAPDRPVDADAAAFAAIGADLVEGEAGAIVTAFTAGDARAMAEALRAMDGADASPIPILRAIARRLMLLAELRQGLDGGESLDTLGKRHRIHFRELPTIGAALPHWTPRRIANALNNVRRMERRAIAAGPAGRALADVALMELAAAIGGR